ncbi:MAG: hypothetical protein GW946_03570 [Candidatus Pacebacteria bacterium]|nr:hypothetical protein [Candidatus Paceibacterota bacterium]PIR59920.1 MAG: hypothetical protein COU67_04010 [Candidatus Pacebacteria bacterium CG10_big_fil_rev_8_21_14_0_10_44_54]
MSEANLATAASERIQAIEEEIAYLEENIATLQEKKSFLRQAWNECEACHHAMIPELRAIDTEIAELLRKKQQLEIQRRSLFE